MLRVGLWILALSVIAGTSMACGGKDPGEHYQDGLVAERQVDWERAARAFDEAGDYQDAAQRARQARENLATVTAAYERGKIAYEAEDYAQAFGQFSIVKELSPEYEDVQSLLLEVTNELDSLVAEAQQLESAGDIEGALQHYRAAGDYGSSPQDVVRLSGLHNELERWYGEMVTLLNAGDRQSGLDVASKILERAKGYRDTQSLFEDELTEMFADAEAAFSDERWLDVIGVLELLLKHSPSYEGAAELLGRASAEVKKVRPGTYFSGSRELSAGSFCLFCVDMDLYLERVDVFEDGTMRFTLRWHNPNSRTGGLKCPDSEDASDVYIATAAQERVEPIDTFCSANPGLEIRVLPRDSYEVWAVFPVVRDATIPFAFYWYDNSLGGLVFQDIGS